MGWLKLGWIFSFLILALLRLALIPEPSLTLTLQFFVGFSIIASATVIGDGNSTSAIAAYVNEALESEIQALRIDFGGSNGAIAVGEENILRIDFGGSSGAIAVGEENIGGGNLTAAIAAHVNEALEPEIQALRIDFGGSSGAIVVGEEKVDQRSEWSDRRLHSTLHRTTRRQIKCRLPREGFGSPASLGGNKQLWLAREAVDCAGFKLRAWCLRQSHFRLRGSVRISGGAGIFPLFGHSVLGQLICPKRKRGNLGTRMHGALGGEFLGTRTYGDLRKSDLLLGPAFGSTSSSGVTRTASSEEKRRTDEQTRRLWRSRW